VTLTFDLLTLKGQSLWVALATRCICDRTVTASEDSIGSSTQVRRRRQFNSRD